jgi:type II secretory pathway component PulF
LRNQTNYTHKAQSPFGRRIGKDSAYFFDVLSMLLQSGSSAQEALSSMEKSKSRTFVVLCRQISKALNEGSPLWKAMDSSGSFSAYAISTVRVGENSGTLADNLRLLAEHENRRQVLQSKISSALFYPGLVLGATLLLGFLSAWFIFPKLLRVFTDLHVKLEAPTRLLLWLSRVVPKYGFVILIVSVLIIVGVAAAVRKIAFVGRLRDKLIFSTPIIKNLLRSIETERFGLVLGTMLSSGIPMPEALSILQTTTPLTQYRAIYKKLEIGVNDGNPMHVTFEKIPNITRYFDDAVMQMLRAAEQSGRIPETLSEVSKRYREKVEIQSNNLAQSLEPLLLLFVGSFVAFIAFSILSPIYSIYSSFNNNMSSAAVDTTSDASTAEQRASLPKLTTKGTQDIVARGAGDSTAKITAYLKPGLKLPYRTLTEFWVEIILEDGKGVWTEKTNVEL